MAYCCMLLLPLCGELSPVAHCLTCQHADHGEQDLLHALDGAPPLGATLVAHGVVAGGVQDGDAHAAVRVDCGREGKERLA